MKCGWQILQCLHTRCLIDLEQPHRGRNSVANTALFVAVSTGNLPMLKWLKSAYGMDMKKGDNIGRTPAYYAKASGQLEVIKWLETE